MQLRYSLLAATSLVASTILAQPVIDASNNVPLYSAGQQFSVEQTAAWLDQGPTGANVTYNYWYLISTG
ncbi:MAG TPA: hypothetical protein VKG92_07905, partial [Flavobacteriales bacterium]|nr:hypothetical protein [Flavobacteriales bacterium]